MSSEYPFEDLSQEVLPPSEPGSKPELLDSGIREVDGITFTSIEAKIGEEIHAAQSVTFTEGSREFHVMPSRDSQGNLATAVVIVSEKQEIGEELEARAAFYLLTSEKLVKGLDGKYRGPVKNFPSFRENLEYVLEGKYREHPCRRVEE